MKMPRPNDRPASTSMDINATPTARRSSVLRRSRASATARIASTRAITGAAHLSLTTRLNNPENFETCCFDTTVKLTPCVDTALIGLKIVTPWASRSVIRLLSAGDRLRAIWPPVANFFCSGVCLPVRTFTTASWLCRFNVSHSLPNCGLEKTLSAKS